MTDRELGEALLGTDPLQLALTAEDRQQALRLIERDLQRVRRLAGLAVLLATLAAALVLLGILQVGLLYPEQDRLTRERGAGRLTLAEREHVAWVLATASQRAILLTALGVAALALAVLCAVWLAAAARRAMLRQVALRLVEVGERLRRPGLPGQGPAAVS